MYFIKRLGENKDVTKKSMVFSVHKNKVHILKTMIKAYKFEKIPQQLFNKSKFEHKSYRVFNQA